MKRLMYLAGLSCGILCGASEVMAQDEPGTFRAATTEEKSVASTASVSESNLNTKELDVYHRATMNLAVGELSESRRLFQTLTASSSKSSLGMKAQEILEVLDGPAGLKSLLERRSPKGPRLLGGETTKQTLTTNSSQDPSLSNSPTRLARGELVTTQTLHGIILGVELCAVLECLDARTIVSASLLGGAAGLTGSLLYSPDGVRPGQTAAINSGTVMGAWTLFSMSLAFELTDNASGLTGLLMLGQVAGTVAGGLAYEYFQPSAGDVSLVNSATIWSSALTGLFLGVADVDRTTTIWTNLFVISHLSAATMAYFAKDLAMSRGRVLLIDGSAVLGGLVGAAAVVLTVGETASGEAVQMSTALGITAGLALGTYLTRNFDIPDPGVSMALLPAEGGGLLTVGAQF